MMFDKIPEPIRLHITTRTPGKWVAVDLESREAWSWDSERGHWIRARGEYVRALREAAASAPE